MIAAAGEAPRRWLAAGQSLMPGLLAVAIVTLAATYLSDHYGAPAIVFALLLGMALNTLSAEARYTPGIAFSARTLLRISVALLGLRITFQQIGALGWSTAAMVLFAVAGTIGFGWCLARAMKTDSRFGVLSGGAVGICGASAAMAIACAWPRRDSERDTVIVIACITSLSTIAMLAYPALAVAAGLDHQEIGRFLGGSIHDVAQVVGAGFTVSPETGDTATIVKLMRVALLLPVVLLISMGAARFARGDMDGAARVTPLPAFLVVFVILAGANGMGVVPAWMAAALGEASRWLLVMSVAALGIKTSARDLIAAGHTAVVMVAAETLFIAVFVLAWIELGG